MRFLFLLLLALAVVWVFGFSWLARGADAPGIEVVLSETARITGEVIRLGAVAEIQGDDPELAARLASLELGPAPAPGAGFSLSAATIRTRFKQAGIDLDRVRLTGAAMASIERESVLIPKDRIAELAAEHLRKLFAGTGEVIDFQRIVPASEARIPDGPPVRHEVETPDAARFMASPMVTVVFYAPGGDMVRVPVTARVSRSGDVVVAARPLARLEPLTASSVKLLRVDLGAVPSEAYVRLEEVAGLRAKRAIAAGTVLTPALLDSPPLVRRGEMVKLVAGNESFQITAMGEARRDGRKGEQIPVLNLSSRREVFGRVVEPGVVRVEY